MKVKLWIVILASLIAVSGVSTGKEVPANDTTAGRERVPVLIGFTKVPGPSEQALVRGHGGVIKYSYRLVPAVAASIPEPAIQPLLRNPNVTNIDPDIKVYAVDAELDNSWGVKHIGAGLVHDRGNKGAGVKVAIIDSGIDYTHLDLNGNYVGGYDFVNNDSDPMDDDGHGTHVAGTVAAEDDGIGVVGVAPLVQLYGLKVLDADGSGNYSDVIAALEWAVSNGIQVTNNSYGSAGDPGGAVKTAFDNACAAGILNVCAAGNSGTPPGKGDNVIYPARYESCIAVAATDQSDSRAKWSSTGPDMELSAPGVSIISTLPGGGYGTGSGTSMASPHVAGTAALVLSAYPSWTNAQVAARLRNTADDLGVAGWDSKYGYGLVNADEAAPDTTPPEPTHDVAVTALAAPGSVIAGVTAEINVTVENQGTFAESFDVVLTDNTDSVTIGTQSVVTLAAGASTTLTYLWNTNSATIGEHTLTAAAGPVTDETDTADNSMSTTVNVTEAGATMHVGDLDGVKNLRGASGNWEMLVTAAIHDENENPVADATVTGEWSGDITGTVSGTTASDGTVTFTTGNMKGGTSVTFTVTGVTHQVLTYDDAANHDPDGDSDGTSITVDK